jgi:hypothetical protein
MCPAPKYWLRGGLCNIAIPPATVCRLTGAVGSVFGGTWLDRRGFAGRQQDEFVLQQGRFHATFNNLQQQRQTLEFAPAAT